jgi:hypothetical protein
MKANPGRFARRRPTSLVLLAMTAAATAGPPALPLALPAGAYTLAAQTLMPHLDEMRWVVRREERCYDGSDALPSLFPVLRQAALTGCSLGSGERDGERLRYELTCASPRVATGSAEILPTAQGAVGKLEVRMGGKNMTFSQRVEALRHGDCGPAPRDR